MMFVPLTPALLDQDYAAVMRDITMLRAWSGQDWPTADFPIESNLADLVRHDREQRDGIALTYSVLLHGVVQGCIYVRPALRQVPRVPISWRRATSWASPTCCASTGREARGNCARRRRRADVLI